jgi:L-threonylcarbamoyladenylate synthase
MSALIIKKDSPFSSEKTARVLREGARVIIPTDTVYGFSALAPLRGEAAYEARKNAAAISDIKGRDGEAKPLIRLVARPEDIFFYAADPIPASLLRKWPGALTVIARLKNELVFEGGSAEDASCAFRCPADAWLCDVIERAGAPIFSTSANRTGQPVITKIERIIEEFSRDVNLIVDGGDTKEALPSTIVAVSTNALTVVRQGAVIADDF